MDPLIDADNQTPELFLNDCIPHRTTKAGHSSDVKEIGLRIII